MALSVQDHIPNFTAVTHAGDRCTKRSLKGSWTVLYFYPKDNTTGCTRQACELRDEYKAIAKRGVRVIGVSPDSVRSHVKFRDEHQLNFDLFSDEDHSMCEAFDVWKEKSMYGRKYMGVVRTTYIIDPKGVIQRVWDNVKVPEHVVAVLSALDELGL